MIHIRISAFEISVEIFLEQLCLWEVSFSRARVVPCDRNSGI